jgi:polygalacturonase
MRVRNVEVCNFYGSGKCGFRLSGDFEGGQFDSLRGHNCDTGLRFGSTFNNHVLNNTQADQNATYGLHLDGSDSVLFNGGLIQTNEKTGLYVTQCIGVTFKNFHFENNNSTSTADQYAIKCQGATNQPIQKLYVENCNFLTTRDTIYANGAAGYVVYNLRIIGGYGQGPAAPVVTLGDYVTDSEVINFVPRSSVTGTALRTHVSYNGVDNAVRVYNVRDYGATGNGSTNDSATIQAAIAAALATGGSVYFPVGVYKCNISVVGTSVHLSGAAVTADALGSELIPNSLTSPVLSIGNGSTTTNNIKVSNLTIKGTGAGASSDGLVVTGANYCSFTDLNVRTFGRDNVSVTSTVAKPTTFIYFNGLISESAAGDCLSVDYGPGGGSYTTGVFVNNFVLNGLDDAAARALRLKVASLYLNNGWIGTGNAQGHVTIDPDGGVLTPVLYCQNVAMDSGANTDTLVHIAAAKGLVGSYIQGKVTIDGEVSWSSGTDTVVTGLGGLLADLMLSDPHISNRLNFGRADAGTDGESFSSPTYVFRSGASPNQTLAFSGNMALRPLGNYSYPLQFGAGGSLWRDANGALRYDKGTWWPAAVTDGVHLDVSEVFNVKNYGAVGDGVADDTAAIQSAIAACNAASGGVVFFPSGTYAISLAASNYCLNIGFSNIALVGERGSVLKLTSDAIALLCDTVCSNLTIKNLKVTSAGYGYNDAGIITLNKVTNLRVENVEVVCTTFVNSGVKKTDGITCSQGTTGVFKNCYVTACPKTAFYISTGSLDVLLDGCKATHTVGYTDGGVQNTPGFGLASGGNTRFIGCVAHNCSGDGFAIQYVSDIPKNAQLIGCSSYSNSVGLGIRSAHATIVPTDVLVSGMQIHNNSTYGVLVEAGLDLVFDNPVIYNNGIHGMFIINAMPGTAEHCHRVLINNPYCKDNATAITENIGAIGIADMRDVTVNGGTFIKTTSTYQVAAFGCNNTNGIGVERVVFNNPTCIGTEYVETILSSGWTLLGATGAAAPTTREWSLGTRVHNTAPAAGGYEGWICTTAGSFDTYGGAVTCTTNGTTTVTLSASEAAFAPGRALTINGTNVTVVSNAGTTLVVSATIAASGPGTTITYTAPVFKTFGPITAVAGSSGLLQGSVADSGSAVANIVDNSVTLATSGAKLLSVRNNTVEKAFVRYDGLINTVSNVCAQGNVQSDLFQDLNGDTVVLRSQVLEGGSPKTAVILRSATGMTVAGSKLLSVQSATTEKASIDKDGALVCAASVSAPTINVTGTSGLVITGSTTTAVTLPAGSRLNWGSTNIEESSTVLTCGTTLASSTMQARGGDSLLLRGRQADGGSAVSTIIDSLVSLTTAGAKLVSVRNNTVEKLYVDKDGNIAAATDVGASLGVQARRWDNAFIRYFRDDNNNLRIHGFGASDQPGTLLGAVTGASTALKFGNTTSLSTAGAKIASFYSDNVTTEKLYVDKDGNVVPATTNASTLGAVGKRWSALHVASIGDSQTDNRINLNTNGNISHNIYTDASGVGDATSIAHIFRTAGTYGTSGAKLASFQNLTTEKAHIDKDGSARFLGTVRGDAFYVDNGSILTYNAVTLTLGGNAADGGSAVAAIIKSSSTYSTAGAKLLSIQNNTTEKAYVDYAGNLGLAGTTIDIDGTGAALIRTDAAASNVSGTTAAMNFQHSDTLNSDTNAYAFKNQAGTELFTINKVGVCTATSILQTTGNTIRLLNPGAFECWGSSGVSSTNPALNFITKTAHSATDLEFAFSKSDDTKLVTIRNSGVVSCPTLGGTSASATGVTTNAAAELRTFVQKVTVTEAALTDADTSQAVTIWTAPAKTRILRVIADVTTTFTGGGTTACTLQVGISGGDADAYIVASNVFASAVTLGIVEADLGVALSNSGSGAGAFPNFGGTQAIAAQFDTTTANVGDLTTGSVTFYIEYATY